MAIIVSILKKPSYFKLKHTLEPAIFIIDKGHATLPNNLFLWQV
jgi:hypothetical protein